MTYKIHIASKMFLKDPYIVRMDHAESTEANFDLSKFRKILRSAKLMIRDSWGYSHPVFEVTQSEEISVYVNGSRVAGYNSPRIATESTCRSYWAFTNEMDAVQFKLTHGESAKRMHIWPSNTKFTITEYFYDKNTST